MCARYQYCNSVASTESRRKKEKTRACVRAFHFIPFGRGGGFWVRGLRVGVAHQAFLLLLLSFVIAIHGPSFDWLFVSDHGVPVSVPHGRYREGSSVFDLKSSVHGVPVAWRGVGTVAP